MDATTSAINVNDFVTQRSNEIRQLFMALKAERISRTPMQRLPRHMRRRAMSHNIKRMPRRWRNYAYAATKKAKHAAKPPSRYQRRRRQFTIGSNPLLLRTHIWHAKRYHMTLTYNMKLPRKCFQKVQRNCVRKTAKGATLVDHTYYTVFDINCPPELNESVTESVNAAVGKTLDFSYQRAHYVSFMQGEFSTGPVIIRKPTESSFEFVIHPTSSSLIESLLPAAVVKQTALYGRACLYGPKALKTIITAFKLTPTSDDNMFNDVLNGALIVSSVWFRLVIDLPNQKSVPIILTIVSMRPHVQIDIAVPKEYFKDVWVRLVHTKCRVLGLEDEWNIRAYLGKFSHPEDDPKCVLSEKILSEETCALTEKHRSRPTNRRVNYEALSPENPFSFNWDALQSENESDLVPIKIVPLSRGVPKRFAFLYSKVDPLPEPTSPVESDTDSTPSQVQPKGFDTDGTGFIAIDDVPGFPNVVPMSSMFEIESKKESRTVKRRRKRKNRFISKPIIEKTEGFLIPQGKVIGRIVRGLRWTSPNGNNLGLGYCLRSEAEKIIADKNGIVMFRNPESHQFRKAKFIICDKNTMF